MSGSPDLAGNFLGFRLLKHSGLVDQNTIDKLKVCAVELDQKARNGSPHKRDRIIGTGDFRLATIRLEALSERCGEFHDLCYGNTLREFTYHLFREVPVVLDDVLISVPPGGPSVFTWHRDPPFEKTFKSESDATSACLKLGLAITPSDKKSGCLEVDLSDNGLVYELGKDIYEPNYVELAPGDVSAHWAGSFHRSGNNFSEEFRYVYYVTLCNKLTFQCHFEKFYGEYLNLSYDDMVSKSWS